MTAGQADQFEVATLHVAAGVAEFVHEQPKARNPLGQPLRRDYVRMLDRIEADASIRVLILRGAGGSFSAGGDVREMTARLEHPEQHTPETTRRRIENDNAWLQRLLQLRAVVIAAVDGAAFGGGFSLALHADLVLATPGACFCMSFPRIGAVPDFGAHYLLQRIAGLGAARELLITGRTIDAQEARSLHMVHAIHPADQLVERARETARRLCTGPAEVFATTKRLLNQSAQADYRAMGALEAEAQGSAMSADYHHDAARRFTARQPLAYDWDRDARDLGFQPDDRT
ncbi:4-chlorobenzoyl coenzyme A dehalogenase [Variovorax sp. PBL-H6]|uniref:enoyl-CoA hydratase/isomerase family protein n=1 Tax=Variovorax sp. PBL-H6 TaxID=434009 RepID=UPI0013174D49|nr:enoyl-CoA hydratase/isomerase family protein [Variovorax sp. PBL-H6]VTU27399.1 4-chlorobenzoyl coenzyme A dehalogenase [Variovorax sp. PBL-H6]